MNHPAYPLSLLFAVFVIHFVFDFVLQSHRMAANKSKSLSALTDHVLVYSSGLAALGIFCFQVGWFADIRAVTLWVVFNSLAHFATDYFTSRQTAKRFNKDWHNFFVWVGADQLIHYTTLLGSLLFFHDVKL